MGRLRPAVKARAHAESVNVGADCSICGNSVHAGGYWRGATDLYICSPDCSRKLLLLALDTVADHRGDRPELAEWLRTTSEAFDRWSEAYDRQEGRR